MRQSSEMSRATTNEAPGAPSWRRRRRRRRSMDLAAGLLCLAAMCWHHVTADPRQFLYVPEGGTRDEGVVLRQIGRDELPPGQYEVVATFGQGGGEGGQDEPSPFADYRLQAEASSGHYHGRGSPLLPPPPHPHHHRRYPPPPPPTMPKFENFPASADYSNRQRPKNHQGFSNQRSGGFDGADYADYVSTLTQYDAVTPEHAPPPPPRKDAGGYRLPGVVYAARPALFDGGKPHRHRPPPPREDHSSPSSRHHRGDVRGPHGYDRDERTRHSNFLPAEREVGKKAPLGPDVIRGLSFYQRIDE